MNIGQLLNALESRLPELEWRIGYINPSLLAQALPAGLFRPQIEPSSAGCIDEIKQDIAALARQDSEKSAFFLANRIHQKINVLIDLCKTRDNKPQTDMMQAVLYKINTRKQHIEALESDILSLEIQKKSLKKRAASLETESSQLVLLKIQKELGAIERKLTVLLEERNKVVV